MCTKTKRKEIKGYMSAVCDSQGRKKKRCESIVELGSVPKTVLTTVKEVKSCGVDVGTPTSTLVSLTAYHPQTRAPSINVVKQERNPASAVMGCRTVIRMKLDWAKWGSKARGPRLRNSANSSAHSSSCWLNLLKNLHTGIHHTQQI